MTATTQTTLADRGRKHRCAECGAAFYDMNRGLTACPKCETPYEASPAMPTGAPGGARKRKWSRQAPAPAEPAAEDAAAAKDKDDDEDGVPILDDADEAAADPDADLEAEGDEAEEPEKER